MSDTPGSVRPTKKQRELLTFIVEDADGVAIRPGLWAERPTVPDYLIAVQQTLIDSQTAES